MNIINTQNTTQKAAIAQNGKAESAEGNLLAGLMGNLNPKEAEANKAEFQNLLAEVNPENQESEEQENVDNKKTLFSLPVLKGDNKAVDGEAHGDSEANIVLEKTPKKSFNPLNLLRKNKTVHAEQEKNINPSIKNEEVVAERKPFFVTPKNAQIGKNQIINNDLKSDASEKLVDTKGLLNLNQFMAKQSPALQKNAMAKSYPSVSKSMFDKKVNDSLPGVIKMQGATEINTKEEKELLGEDLTSKTELSDKMDNSLINQKLSRTDALANTKSVKPSFDISQLNGSESSDEVINKVQDYIIQSKAQNQKQVEMSFNHQELGKVDLMVQKAAGDHLNIVITSHGSEGTHFFQKHQGELLQTLSHNGVQVNDFKLESGQSSQSNMNQDSNRGQFSQNSRQGFGSEQGERQSESQKRHNLWNQFYDKEVA